VLFKCADKLSKGKRHYEIGDTTQEKNNDTQRGEKLEITIFRRPKIWGETSYPPPKFGPGRIE